MGKLRGYSIFWSLIRLNLVKLFFFFQEFFRFTVCSFILSLFFGFFFFLWISFRCPTDPLMCLANRTTTVVQLKPDYSSSLWSVAERAGRDRERWVAKPYRNTHTQTYTHRLSHAGFKVASRTEDVPFWVCEIESSVGRWNVLSLSRATVQTHKTDKSTDITL